MSSPQTDTTTSSDSPTVEDSTAEKSSPEPQAPNPAPEDSTGGEQDSPQQVEDSQPDPKPENKEAAKYRRRLRETEQERDHLTARLESVATHVIDQQAARHGLNAQGLAAAGHDLTSFFTEEGTFDAHAVKEAAQDVAQRFGIPRPSAAGYVPGSGTGGEKANTSGWESVIKSK